MTRHVVPPQLPTAPLKDREQLKFGWEPFGVVIREALPMLRAFWKETEPFGDVYPFDMDYDAYFAAERQGRLHIFTVRDGDALVGAHWWVLSPNTRRRTVPYVVSDCILLAPAWRRGWVGYKLLKDSDARFIELGAKMARVTIASQYRLDPLLKRAGYKPVGAQWEKVLVWPEGYDEFGQRR